MTQNEKGIGRLSEALDIIKTANEEPISVRELVPERFYTDVIEDFQKGFVIEDLLVLMLVLTALSSVLPMGTKVRLLDDTDWDQAMVLFFMAIAMSGSKKTALFKSLCESPIKNSGIKKRDRQKFNQTKSLEAEVRKAYKAKGIEQVGLSSELLDKLNRSSPIEILQHIVNDFTGEGIDRNCQQAEQHYNHGFLIGTDEGRQLMSGDQYKNSGSTYTIDKLTRIYDGGGNVSLRASASSERHYEQSHVAVALMIQPEIYDQIAAKQVDDQSGFWPRFLAQDFLPVTTRKLSREERQARKVKKYPELLAQLFDMANQINSPVISSELIGRSHFRFSDDAQEWFAERNHEIEARQLHENQHGDPMIARVLGKAAGQIGRLAAMLHLLDELMLMIENDQYRVRKEVSLESVQKAFRLQAHLMSKTLKQRLRATGSGAGDDTKLLKDVQERCLKKDPDQKGLKLGTITKFWNQKNQPDKETLFQALCVLAADGFGELQRGPGNRSGFVYTATETVAVLSFKADRGFKVLTAKPTKISRL